MADKLVVRGLTTVPFTIPLSPGVAELFDKPEFVREWERRVFSALAQKIDDDAAKEFGALLKLDPADRGD